MAYAVVATVKCHVAFSWQHILYPIYSEPDIRKELIGSCVTLSGRCWTVSEDFESVVLHQVGHETVIGWGRHHYVWCSTIYNGLLRSHAYILAIKLKLNIVGFEWPIVWILVDLVPVNTANCVSFLVIAAKGYPGLLVTESYGHRKYRLTYGTSFFHLFYKEIRMGFKMPRTKSYKTWSLQTAQSILVGNCLEGEIFRAIFLSYANLILRNVPSRAAGSIFDGRKLFLTFIGVAPITIELVHVRAIIALWRENPQPVRSCIKEHIEGLLLGANHNWSKDLGVLGIF